MKAARQGGDWAPPRFRVEELSDPTVATEALARWDELEPDLLGALAAHPQHGPRLEKLKAADRWLRTHSSGEHRDPGACPTADELYDYGRGPGYGQLLIARRAEIDRHLVRCAECEFLVETLDALPPVPLDVAPPVETSHAGDAQTGRGIDRRASRRMRLLAPLAVAAAVITVVWLWIAYSGDQGASLRFPESPLLRGAAGGPLLFPRDRVLHPTDAVHAAWPVLGQPPIFEVEPQDEATTYRVDLSPHDGSAFAPIEPMSCLAGSTPMLAGAPILVAGHYTWEAWVVARGLDKRLGARDFEVAEDADLCARLLEIASRSEPERSLDAVRLLHEHGWRTDARAIARTMPKTPERDAYLGQVPGR